MEKFFEITRKYIPTGKIKLLTNGILLKKMKDSFWEAVEKTNSEIWVTKYPIQLDWKEIEKLALRERSILHYFNQEPVRTLGYQPLDVTGSRDFLTNFDGCYRANTCILLEHGKLYTCFLIAESRHFNKFFNEDLKISEEDYVDIYKAGSGTEILERLTKPTPFCRYCNRDDVDIFGKIPWEQTKKKMEE